MATFEEMLAVVEAMKPLEITPERDIKKLFPDLTIDDTYRLQFELMRKRVAAGDKIIGYKASATRRNAAKQRPGVPVPSIGTFLRSALRNDGDTVEIESKIGIDLFEPEILILLKRGLEGPGITPMDVLAATEAVFPSIEIAPLRAGVAERKWSDHHIIVNMKINGSIIVGHQGFSPKGIDLRLEGVVGRVDGVVGGSATGVEVMGSPLNVVAAIANKLADFGIGLKAGEMVQTGSMTDPIHIKPGMREAVAEFTRIGSCRVRFAS